MFFKGDIIQRHPEYYDAVWKDWCDVWKCPLDVELKVIDHLVDTDCVKFIDPDGKEWSVWDFKMQRAKPLTLENE